tara:strand:- start:366 stop:473 length:108 start_codon:yes stop_codon:yes gene_type:complete
MDILIPLGIITIIALYAVKKLRPELWKKTISRFKK